MRKSLITIGGADNATNIQSGRRQPWYQDRTSGVNISPDPQILPILLEYP